MRSDTYPRPKDHEKLVRGAIQDVRAPKLSDSDPEKRSAADVSAADRTHQAFDPPLEWLVIGGGIHGVHLAARLIGEAEVPRDRIRIIDPEERLLARWRTCTAATGMNYLRSPSIHHLGLSPWCLERFAGKRRSRPPGLFAAPYDRPSLEFFNLHCDHVIETFGLSSLHVKSRVMSCSPVRGGVEARLASGELIRTERVVLALGTEKLCWPKWAPRSHPCVHHVFGTPFDEWSIGRTDAVAIVGGGISAAQVALRLRGRERRIHLVCRHELRRHQFDSDPGWLGPKHMTRFLREPDRDRRREMINGARHRGSVPPAVHRRLGRAIEREEIDWHKTGVESLTTDRDQPSLRLSNDEELAIDHVLLATGMEPGRPGGEMVDDLAASANLPVARCGFPIVDRALRWHPRIHVTGALAELELGPSSKNIAGARRAGERILAACQASEKSN